MKLITSESAFELTLVQYQFAGISSDVYDSNWLVVQVRASHEGRSWEFTDPCLLTWEVESLIAFLHAAANGSADPEGLTFIEPNLSFFHTNLRLRVGLELEARPPWAKSPVMGEEACFIELEVSQSALLAASESLRTQASRFPMRGTGHPANAA